MIFHIVLRRLLIGVGLLFVVSAMAFALVSLIPGDAATAILGPYASTDSVDALRQQMGLNLPLWHQYVDWAGRAVRGDLGTSIMTSQPVTQQLDQGVLVSLPLALGAVVVSTVVGVASGTVAAVRGRFLARSLDAAGLVAMALPAFWVALILSNVFGVRLGWFPATGFVPFLDSPTQWARSLVLPVVSLSVGGVAIIAKQSRDAVDDVLHRDFVDVLRVEGISNRRILFRHVLKNAAIPVLSVSGTQFVASLGGAVLIENIFGLPGLGSMAVSATQNQDLPMIVGAAIYFCLVVIAVNLVLDLVYAAVNPKVQVTS